MLQLDSRRAGPFAASMHGRTARIERRTPESVAQRAAAPEASNRWDEARCLGRLLKQVLDSPATTIEVDLQDESVANTALIAVLIDANRRARQDGTVLVVRPAHALRQLAEVCRVQGVLSLA